MKMTLAPPTAAKLQCSFNIDSYSVEVTFSTAHYYCFPWGFQKQNFKPISNQLDKTAQKGSIPVVLSGSLGTSLFITDLAYDEFATPAAKKASANLNLIFEKSLSFEKF